RPGQPYLDAVTWSFGMHPVAQRFKFEDAELDSVRELPQADQMRFESDARWRPFGEHEPSRNIYAQGMNVEMAPFDNVEVRRAVAAVIDREHIRLVKPGTVRPAYQLLPPSVPGFGADLPEQRHDPAAALEHMRRAGYPFDPKTGAGGFPGTIVY